MIDVIPDIWRPISVARAQPEGVGAHAVGTQKDRPVSRTTVEHRAGARTHVTVRRPAAQRSRTHNADTQQTLDTITY